MAIDFNCSVSYGKDLGHSTHLRMTACRGDVLGIKSVALLRNIHVAVLSKNEMDNHRGKDNHIISVDQTS